jgi:glycosyltransferase involved in cell wall biosynthesis
MHTEMNPELPRPPLHVLHLTISFARGGRRDAILTLARAGRNHGVIPFLATLRGSPEDSSGVADAFETVVDLGIRSRPTPRQLHELRDRCREWGIQVVHAHDASSQLVASMLRVVAPSLRLVMTFHRSLGFESAGWRNRFRNALTLPLVGRVLTASDERRQHFLAENLVRKAKVLTIPLGTDLSRFRPDGLARKAIRAELGMQDQDLLVVTAGHFGDEKGVDLAIEAVGRALDTPPPLAARMAVMGTGDPDRVEMVHALGRRWLGDRITFLGQRSDPERVFAAADLVVHSPRLEAFGLVVVQAMACGVPVVAANVGGLPEIVTDGVTGLLAPHANPVATAPLIRGLLQSASRRNLMAEAALQRASAEYTADRSAARHRAVYDQLLRAG